MCSIGGMQPSVELIPQRTFGQLVDVIVTVIVFIITLIAMCIAASMGAVGALNMTVPCGRCGLILSFAVFPTILLFLCLVLSLILAHLESWDVWTSFLFMVSLLCGMGEQLTNATPSTQEAMFFSLLCCLLESSIGGVIIGIVGAHPKVVAFISCMEGGDQLTTEIGLPGKRPRAHGHAGPNDLDEFKSVGELVGELAEKDRQLDAVHEDANRAWAENKRLHMEIQSFKENIKDTEWLKSAVQQLQNTVTRTQEDADTQNTTQQKEIESLQAQIEMLKLKLAAQGVEDAADEKKTWQDLRMHRTDWEPSVMKRTRLSDAMSPEVVEVERVSIEFDETEKQLQSPHMETPAARLQLKTIEQPKQTNHLSLMAAAQSVRYQNEMNLLEEENERLRQELSKLRVLLQSLQEREEAHRIHQHKLEHQEANDTQQISALRQQLEAAAIALSCVRDSSICNQKKARQRRCCAV